MCNSDFQRLSSKYNCVPKSLYLAHRPVTTTNIDYKINVVLSNKCTGTIEDSKPANTSPYDGTEPVILLRPEDMHARVNHQPTMCSHVDLEIHL